ncbi:sulfite exporter TauE/SafE family protein [Mordavella massiliensis]|uniref:Sulfite exporter TauE/SafE family protein n=1 Tax=Mordavella massiliensis TaxID=1871024 RepID=A0A938XA51_9CLOT|nr:sulfite exporter TauE/SafE family protein [Mordavella massiliensis]
MLIRDVRAHKDELDKTKLGYNSLISMIANFFDTLGIGSYAIATSAWKFNKSVHDDLIPGTLNVAFGIPICVEATITMTRIEMDSLTLVLMIAAAIIGSILGAKIISRMDIMKIRVVMGVALIIVALITLCKINAVGPFGILGTARGLEGGMLALGVIANFILGILMTAGIGLYAPCMAIVLLLGMSADVAFPVMMGSCAYLCPACGITFIREGKYNRASTIPMIITGSIGVLIAGFIVTSLPLTVLTYLVCVVMVICAIMFFHDAAKQKK